MSAPQPIKPQAVPFGQGCIILDVRTGVEHTGISLRQPHHHIPIGDLDADKFLRQNKIEAASPVYTLCHSGKRATLAAQALVAAGHGNVYVIEGGIVGCEAAGIPLIKKTALSLERQVRIAAGSLVFLGVASGALLSPWFYAVAGLVGCGLVFAGITDSCGMAYILAKAPWNKPPALEKPASCAAVPSCLMESSKGELPEEITFYSPANGKPVPVQYHALTKTSGTAGGCS